VMASTWGMVYLGVAVRGCRIIAAMASAGRGISVVRATAGLAAGEPVQRMSKWRGDRLGGWLAGGAIPADVGHERRVRVVEYLDGLLARVGRGLHAVAARVLRRVERAIGGP
jgi:hypothetical protein